MIEFVKGDILESDCEAIVNTVNCYGKMGREPALEGQRRFPAMFLSYKHACDQGIVKVGSMHLWKNPDGGFVVNFPTKDHWKQPSQMIWIVQGLTDLAKVIKENKIKSIAIPALGCNLGGLQWYLVKQEVQKAHDIHWENIRVVVYLPHTT